MPLIEGEPEVTDIALVPHPYAEADSASSRRIVRFDRQVQLHEDLWLGPVDHDLSEAVLDACDPRGENFDPTRQYGAPYAFLRTNAPHDQGRALQHDPDNRLFTAIALSRLVHPTNADHRYSARIRQWRNGHRQIVPNQMHALNSHAFVVEPNNAWLIPDDVPSITALLAAYLRRRPNNRVHSALWYYEAAARSYYIDLRWTLLTTGLESLVHIRNERLDGRPAGSTRVFVQRLAGIGRFDSTLAIGESTLSQIYEWRSHLAHGQIFGDIDPDRKLLYSQMDSFMRGVLRKALLDDAFEAVFSTNTTIQTELPISVRRLAT